jgi:hypothetical protein
VVGVGVAFGVIASLAVARLLGEVLFGVSPADVTVLVIRRRGPRRHRADGQRLSGAPRRRIDPMQSLRTE